MAFRGNMRIGELEKISGLAPFHASVSRMVEKIEILQQRLARKKDNCFW